MPSLKERVSGRFGALRERSPLADHTVRTFVHYGERDGNAQAGAVTYFGFLSFFPMLALAFFVVGYVSEVYPGARADLVRLLEELLPGVVGNGQDEIPLKTFEDRAAAVGWLGLVGVVYAGLGWVSGMRRALAVMFLTPPQAQPNLLVGKARDLAALPVLGAVLLLSVALSGAVTWGSERILDRLDVDQTWASGSVLWLVGHGLGIAATTVLLLAMFRMLARPHLAGRALREGAVLGAVGFEVLKSLASHLVELTKGQSAFQAFGVALILLVWINYFSRLVMLGASWGYTAPVAEQVRDLERQPLIDEVEAELMAPAPASVVGEGPVTTPVDRPGRRTALRAWVRRRRRR